MWVNIYKLSYREYLIGAKWKTEALAKSVSDMGVRYQKTIKVPARASREKIMEVFFKITGAESVQQQPFCGEENE